ncbi:MAG: methylenetetrahydrofolate--tRNA-(uracil(54)-C(5))-methyltransferase (FADH(2)-oxidizing) TrmFO [Alphaproteobacteria bacterium]|nr:methylenetetrahydrofolate--tRNA-(uracil(54)-C(5))-methyltransferase (FADH(2)-oxidizing) TrmFO [Alphaproteobacteria bacterium]
MIKKSLQPVHIIGGGLAGSEAAWQLAESNIPVILHEMRPVRRTDAHQSDKLAELVCSNSFRSDDANFNAVGLLHEEMRRLGSLIIKVADNNKIPAGGALAVDRTNFSNEVSGTIENHPLICIKREEIISLKNNDWKHVILATGPLTSKSMSNEIIQLSGENNLAFFDAIAPILYAESIDYDKAWFQSRYDKVGPGGNGKDYINCPLNRDQFEIFVQNLLDADKTEFHEWEKTTPYFEGCLPIEVIANRGRESLRFGPMKPVGLTDPRTGQRAHAVLQLRQDNELGTLYNMVGFQTKLKYSFQKTIFRSIPGLSNAEFARFGGIHRNTFVNSPRILDSQLRLKQMPQVRFAGQITGVEGYVESAATGLLAGIFTATHILNRPLINPPFTTAHGALLNHITDGAKADMFQPMNVNFGLFPPLSNDENTGTKIKKNKRERREAISKRALIDLDAWLNTISLPA